VLSKIIYVNIANMKKLTVIGGGTGTFVALTGLKKYPLELSAIVTMMDSGGSSGRLRDELGVLPPGDIRQCLVALAKSSKLLRSMFNYRFEEGGLMGHTFGNIFLSTLEKTMFNYRFEEGGLMGHTFGNIFLSTLEKTTGSMKKAIDEVGKILQITGRVVPVTFEKSDLCVELVDGRIIKGETHIDVADKLDKRAKIKEAFLSPQVPANEDAIETILNSDYIIIGPGDLYTSIVPNLLVKGIAKALFSTRAKIIFVLNLMTKSGQTTNYKATDHLFDLEKYLRRNTVDLVLINSKFPGKRALDWYSEYGEVPVEDDFPKNDPRIVRKNLINSFLITKPEGDLLKRSIIRHSPAKLADEVFSIISNP